MVEDAVDRLPSHRDSIQIITPLAGLMTNLFLLDGWRNTNPNKKAYTLMQKATGSQSRIDRIYASQDIVNNTSEWEITKTAVPTNHRMVTA